MYLIYSHLELFKINRIKEKKGLIFIACRLAGSYATLLDNPLPKKHPIKKHLLTLE